MITNTAKSRNGVPVRLTRERWVHISTGHPEMADYYFEILEAIENPAVIYKGTKGELVAISGDGNNSEKFIVVVYKETSKDDGFVITAFMSNKKPFFFLIEIVWKQ